MKKMKITTVNLLAVYSPMKGHSNRTLIGGQIIFREESYFDQTVMEGESKIKLLFGNFFFARYFLFSVFSYVEVWRKFVFSIQESLIDIPGYDFYYSFDN